MPEAYGFRCCLFTFLFVALTLLDRFFLPRVVSFVPNSVRRACNVLSLVQSYLPNLPSSTIPNP